MNCAEIEILICDYVDGTLPAERKALVDRHLAGCPGCAELAQDSAAAVAFIEKTAEVAPPPELVTRILFEAPWRKNPRPAGLRSKLAGWLSPVLQPRFVMGAAMTILSFSILSHFGPVRQLKPSDFEPKAIVQGLEDRVMGTWDRAVKFYDNLKFVYQIQTTLHEWQQQDAEQRPATSRKAGQKTDDHKLPQKSAPGGGSNAPAGETPFQTGGANH